MIFLTFLKLDITYIFFIINIRRQKPLPKQENRFGTLAVEVRLEDGPISTLQRAVTPVDPRQQNPLKKKKKRSNSIPPI